MKRKWLLYTIKAIVVCIIVWVLALIIVFFYIKSNKQKILASIKTALSDKISGAVSFDDLSVDFFQNFPGVSVDLENVHIRDSLFPVHRKELLNVRHLYLGFSLLDLVAGKRNPGSISLSNGIIYLFADTAGNKNWKILKKQPPGKKEFDLKKVSFRDINAIFQDAGKFKFYNIWFEKMSCDIINKKDKIAFAMKNFSLLKSTFFNTRAGSYLTNKKLIANWYFEYDKGLKKISLQDQKVKINNQLYKVTGNFFLTDDPYFNLTIETDNLPLNEAASIFPGKTEKKINQFKLSKPLPKVKAYLSGEMKYLRLPLAKIYFSVNDASLDISPVSFAHCSFKATFNNEIDSSKPRDDYNSVIQFTEVKGEWEKNPFDAKNIFFYNLIHPYLKCDVHFMFSLPQLDKAIASSRLDLNSGEGDANLEYAGPLDKTDTVYKLNGTVAIHRGDITYNPRNLNFKNTELELSFLNGGVLVKKMNTEINNDPVRINGRIKDFLNFFNTDSSKATFEWSIYTPHIDIGKLRSSMHRKASGKKKEGYSFFEKLNDKIDRLFDDCNAFLDIKADKLVYRNFSAENVIGRLVLKNDMIGLDSFSLMHAGGSVTVNASSRDRGDKSDLVLHSKMQNINIKELFSAFNNFGMQSLTSKNLNGRFSADINLTSILDANNDLYKPANKGTINFLLQNGKLEDFRPLMEIDNNFLQKKDLSQVNFADLKDQLDIDGNDIKVNRMEIKSTAINMYVEGTYSFATNTDLSIQIPLHGQKMDQGEAPEKKGNHSKGGISVFLRAKDDKDGKLKINYDLLGRFRNKKN
ncbi:MAG TPA: AsmA-like C-terminal region-containing protein [Chitinophagaceae bacterium]|nr:AsmA-like C-terminal region-containing protein [Chitinophagaceae bacterium]